MRSDEIIIRKGNIIDYRSIAGYKYSGYLIADIRTFGFRLRNYLCGQENCSLVAYSLSKKRAIGIVHLRRINDNIWGIWGTFVAPDFRRRGIASNLYKESFEFLRDQGLRKAICTVSDRNIPSLKGIEKIWEDSLDKAIYTLHVSRSSNTSENISVERFDSEYQKDCYDIFSKHVGKEWVEYLEINEGNFMERVFGFAGCEAYGRNMLSRSFLQNRVLTARQDNKLLGYCVYAKSLIFFDKLTRALPHFFLRGINELRICSSPLLRHTGFNICRWIGDVSEEEEMMKAGFEIIGKELVCYKNL
jgi:GNAT superfamily N-acetyltransferase